jgi:CRP-like cAMP-binding protein
VPLVGTIRYKIVSVSGRRLCLWPPAAWVRVLRRKHGDETLPLTHEFLSLMLGVRRAGVNEVLHSLESQKLIYTGTRKVTLRNRKGLERVAGSSYGTPEPEFQRLIS